MIHWHYHRSWQTGGNSIILVGLLSLGALILSLKQYIIDKDFFNMILLSGISLLLIASGIYVKWWAKKNGKK